MTDPTVPISARIEESLNEAMEEIAMESRTSKSEILRHYLREGILSDEETEIPEHLKQQLKRQRAKNANSLKWQRIHFRSNVSDRIKSAFQQGDLDGEFGDEAAEEIRDIYREDAEILFDDDDRQEAAIEYVDAVIEAAKDAADASEFGALDPDEIFEKYGGVRAGREDVPEDDVRAIVIDRLDDNPSTSAAGLRDTIARAYGLESDGSIETIEEIIEDVRRKKLTEQQRRSNGDAEEIEELPEDGDYVIAQGGSRELVNGDGGESD